MNWINSKDQLNWLDSFCAKSRSKFFTYEPWPKVAVNLGDNLISAEECYNLIKSKRSQMESDDVMWKIPIILIALGCILVILMVISFVLQCLVSKLRSSKIANQFIL